MATEKSSTTAQILSIPRAVESSPLTDRIEKRFSQLQAFLAVAVCDDFGTYNRTITSDYLLGCCDMLDALQQDCSELISMSKGLIA